MRKLQVVVHNFNQPQGDGADLDYHGGVPEGAIPTSARYTVVVDLENHHGPFDYDMPVPLVVRPGVPTRFTLTIDRDHHESKSKFDVDEPMMTLLSLQVLATSGAMASSPKFGLEFP